MRFASPMNRAMSGVGGPVVQVLRGGALRDPAVAQHRHPVRGGQRLVLVVGDQHPGGAGLGEHVLHVGPDARAQVRVERGERLVQQHDPGPDGERPGQRHALLLAAGELMRVALAQARQPDRLEQVVDGRPAALA